MDNSKENKQKGRPKKNNDKEPYRNTAFCNKLNKLFGDSGESQEVAANKFNTTRQTFGNWLAGRNQPDYETLIAIAKYYNVSTDYLLGLSPNRTTKEDVKTAIKVTGLSEKAINCSKNMSKIMNNELNFIIENNIFEDIVMILYRAKCKQEYLSGNNTELALQAARSINLIDELGENQSCDALSLLEAYFPTFTDVQFEISALGLEPLYKQKLTESMINLFNEYKEVLKNGEHQGKQE